MPIINIKVGGTQSPERTAVIKASAAKLNKIVEHLERLEGEPQAIDI